MALGTRYDQQSCFLARALEVVGERWTLLILRDCFYGVRRFSDFLVHLDISRAVLCERLDGLVEAGVLVRRREGGHAEYLLTEAGLALWPTVFSLAKWGERYTQGEHPGRIFTHSECGSEIDDLGRCPACGVTPAPYDLVVRPGEGRSPERRSDRVADALSRPHRMLTPVPAAD
jgi:DNA-binding HxlR family transcriptional regulator